jgi:hypothetical protein
MMDDRTLTSLEDRITRTLNAKAAQVDHVESDLASGDLPIVQPTREQSRARGVLVAAASIGVIVIITTAALVVLRDNAGHSVKVPTAHTTAARPQSSPTTLKTTGPADPSLISALAGELPRGYRLHSSDAASRGNGLHFEEAIFVDRFGNVASASVFDIGPGESFARVVSRLGGAASGTPGIYLRTSTRFNSEVVAKLRANRVLTLSSSISRAHEPNAGPFSNAFLVRAAAELAAKL